MVERSWWGCLILLDSCFSILNCVVLKGSSTLRFSKTNQLFFLVNTSLSSQSVTSRVHWSYSTTNTNLHTFVLFTYIQDLQVYIRVLQPFERVSLLNQKLYNFQLSDTIFKKNIYLKIWQILSYYKANYNANKENSIVRGCMRQKVELQYRPTSILRVAR